VPDPCRQLPGNAKSSIVNSPKSWPASTETAAHHHARSIVRLSVLYAWPNVASDIPPVSNSVLAPEVESNSNDHTLTALPHPTTGRQLSNTDQYLEFMSVDMFQHAQVLTLVFDREPSSDILRGGLRRVQSSHTSFFGLKIPSAGQHSPDLIPPRRATPRGFQVNVHLSGIRCFRGGVRVHSDSNVRRGPPSGLQILCKRREDRESLRQSVIYDSPTIYAEDL